jgi:hypothetical protein
MRIIRVAVALSLVLAAASCRKEPLMTEGKASEAESAAKAVAGVAFTVAAHGAQLELTWRNTTGAAIKLATHVFAGENHYDWVKVTLTDRAGASRRLQFMDNRDESAPVVVDLAAGASTTATIDLAAWARRPINGGAPLAPGSYDAKVVYDSSREHDVWAGKLEASVRVDVP